MGHHRFRLLNKNPAQDTAVPPGAIAAAIGSCQVDQRTHSECWPKPGQTALARSSGDRTPRPRPPRSVPIQTIRRQIGLCHLDRHRIDVRGHHRGRPRPAPPPWPAPRCRNPHRQSALGWHTRLNQPINRHANSPASSRDARYQRPSPPRSTRAIRPSGTLSASCAPWTKNRPASTGVNSRRTWATQSVSGTSETTQTPPPHGPPTAGPEQSRPGPR